MTMSPDELRALADALEPMARALKDAMNMPGTRAYQERTIAARRAA